MEKTVSSSKAGMTYGVYLGLLGIVLTVVFFITDLFLNQAVGLGSIALSIAVLCWVYVDYKKKYSSGILSFSDGFKLGFITNVVSGIITSVFKAIYVAFVDPSIVEKTVNYALEEAYKTQPNMPDEAVEMVEKIYGFIAGPTGTIIVGIVGTLIIGAIISLILAAIFKKERPMFEEAEATE